MEKTVLDLINSFGFELISCVFLTLNILSLYKDRVVKGISLISAGFYAFWAWWNVFYYFSLCQTFSYLVGIFVAILTTWWIVLAVYYKKRREKINTFNIEKSFKTKADRNWPLLYVVIDLHGTLIKPEHDSVEFYPDAIEVMKWFNRRSDFKVILWTSSHPEEISNFLYESFLKNIWFDFINENPDEADSKRACFDKKFYFNILLEDKAGFIGETDWTRIKNCLIELGEWNKV